MTIDPERTFLDKILILHGMTYYFEAQGVLRGDGRMSRHYYDVHAAKRGSFRVRPIKEMLEPLKKDYSAMATMIFGDVPTFEEVLASVARAEERLNAV
jgi:hypothetical protein